ncbi:FirrV-1-A38 [Feldmannia irregularis virus a]|uniref:FirrV-1-A38 n=1 Tax=Feldmannia irregularis virus a TaxID=231992 RepID=Q6XM49_9PHYC|nr:FirrV-1-A38 [Feldmannia irregularis virus a]AAR26862.1 FirrV-1-A38 [Feldmannia irregularis virus a]
MNNMKKVGSRASVFRGYAEKTAGGLTKKDLKLNKNGLIVSKKNSSRAKRTESPYMKAWREAVKVTYEDPRFDTGEFHVIKKGTPFYRAVKKEYAYILEESGLPQ